MRKPRPPTLPTCRSSVGGRRETLSPLPSARCERTEGGGKLVRQSHHPRPLLKSAWVIALARLEGAEGPLDCVGGQTPFVLGSPSFVEGQLPRVAPTAQSGGVTASYTPSKA